MKHTFICLLAAFAVATGAAAAAQPAATEIAATGTGSVSLAPDVATVNAAIETNSADAESAISQSNDRYDRVIAALTKLGIARGDIALRYYNIQYVPRPASGSASPPAERYGYTVVRNFSVTVREIGKAGTVSDACIAAGATAIGGVDFGLSDPDVARDRAIAKAVANARSDADALARAAGLHVVRIKSIELGARLGPQPLYAMARTAAGPNPTQFDQSNVNVSVTVTAVFLATP